MGREALVERGRRTSSALGAALIASSQDWVLGWAPHNVAVRALPGYYWVFPTAWLIVLFATGLAVIGPPEAPQ